MKLQDECYYERLMQLWEKNVTKRDNCNYER